MSEALGQRVWAIAEGYIPGGTEHLGEGLESHETACLLNTSDEAAEVDLTVYFADREPAGPYRVTVPPRRTLHVRFNDLTDPEPVPRNVPYASVIRSSIPIVVQHTRLDSRQPPHGLLSTVAWSA
jgi:hypothetical protein